MIIDVDKVFYVLNYINMAVGFLFLPAMFTQVYNILLLWIKPKRFAFSSEKKKFAILIAARNEESVIANTISKLREQDYQKDKFDIFVVAHNCSDRTAEIARKMGAIVYERFDNGDKFKRVAYPLLTGYKAIIEQFPGVYDAIIKFDADNIAKNDYISRMNDALCAGCKIARGYMLGSNLNQNLIAASNGLFSLRCSVMQCKVKERANLNVNLTGCGLMVATEILKRINYWDCFTLAEDVEFAVKRAIDGERLHFVYDAVMYEEQAFTIKDTWNRITRINSASNKVFWKYGVQCVLKAHKNLGNLGIIIDHSLIHLSVVSIIWYPFWFFFMIYLSFANGYRPDLLQQTIMWTCIGFFGIFALQFMLVTTYIYIVERKRINPMQDIKWRALVILTVPFFMMLYTLASFVGIFSPERWKAITRKASIVKS